MRGEYVGGKKNLLKATCIYAHLAHLRTPFITERLQSASLSEQADTAGKRFRLAASKFAFNQELATATLVRENDRITRRRQKSHRRTQTYTHTHTLPMLNLVRVVRA